jgi:hypothetical protein
MCKYLASFSPKVTKNPLYPGILTTTSYKQKAESGFRMFWVLSKICLSGQMRDMLRLRITILPSIYTVR